jgi:hypothetical protein
MSNLPSLVLAGSSASLGHDTLSLCSTGIDCSIGGERRQGRGRQRTSTSSDISPTVIDSVVESGTGRLPGTGARCCTTYVSSPGCHRPAVTMGKPCPRLPPPGCHHVQTLPPAATARLPPWANLAPGCHRPAATMGKPCPRCDHHGQSTHRRPFPLQIPPRILSHLPPIRGILDLPVGYRARRRPVPAGSCLHLASTDRTHRQREAADQGHTQKTLAAWPQPPPGAHPLRTNRPAQTTGIPPQRTARRGLAARVQATPSFWGATPCNTHQRTGTAPSWLAQKQDMGVIVRSEDRTQMSNLDTDVRPGHRCPTWTPMSDLDTDVRLGHRCHTRTSMS